MPSIQRMARKRNEYDNVMENQIAFPPNVQRKYRKRSSGKKQRATTKFSTM